jgi:hypothetical protein
MASPHMKGVPHAYLVTLPTFSSSTYGRALLASKQLRWTSNLPATIIFAWILDNLRKPLLNPDLIDTLKNVDKLIHAKDICTIHNHDFQG